MAHKCKNSVTGICPVNPLLAWAKTFEEDALRAWQNQTGEKDAQKVLDAGAVAAQIQAGIFEEIVVSLRSIEVCDDCPNAAHREEFLRSHSGKEVG